jgi:hypothetical protein
MIAKIRDTFDSSEDDRRGLGGDSSESEDYFADLGLAKDTSVVANVRTTEAGRTAAVRDRFALDLSDSSGGGGDWE